jgi:hypothetical protein
VIELTLNEKDPKIATVTTPPLLRLIGDAVDPGFICTMTSWRMQRFSPAKKLVPVGQEYFASQ